MKQIYSTKQVFLRNFNTYLNIEHYNSFKFIKYFFKYVDKISDPAFFSLKNKIDKVKTHLNRTYIDTIGSTEKTSLINLILTKVRSTHSIISCHRFRNRHLAAERRSNC